MIDLNNQEQQEAAHFKRLLEKSGNTCWSNFTKIGLYRQQLRANLAIDFFQPTSEETIVDVGCGVGYISCFLANSPAKVIGIDITPESIEKAKEIYPKENLEFLLGSIYKLPFEDSSIDFIAGNAVLHHIELSVAVPEILRILKPNGKFIFFEPNMLNPQVYVEKNVKIVGKWLQNTETETAFFKNQIKKDLTELGLKNVEVVPFDFVHPGFPGFCLEPLKMLTNVLEKTPLVKEIAGSLKISATK